MKRFWAALGFLTVFPLPSAWRGGENDLARSVWFFPVVGLLIGLSAAAIAAGLGKLFPPPVLSVLLVVFLAAVHGGLHMDGLSDTADGFLSPHGRERVLEIMKDSRIGVFGSMSIWCVLTLKTAALLALPAECRIKALLLTPLAGRCAMAALLNFLPPSRQSGLGRIFSRNRSAPEWVWAAFFLLCAGWLAAGAAGLAAGAFAFAVSGLFALVCKRRIGGITGDTVGAVSEIVETVTLLIFSLGPVQSYLLQG